MAPRPLGRGPAGRLLSLVVYALYELPDDRRRYLARRLPNHLSWEVTPDRVRVTVAGVELVDEPLATIVEPAADRRLN